MLTATCGNCGRLNRVGDEVAGQKVTCGQCGASVRVPGQAVTAPPTVAQPAAAQPWPDRPAASATAVGPVDLAAPRPTAAPLPPPRRRRVGFHLSRLTLALIIGGVALTIPGFQRLSLSTAAKSAPQDITCQQLSAHGYGDNAHVRVSDFVALSNYIYKKGENGSAWETFWVPLASFDLMRQHLGADGKADVQAVEASDQLHVILKSERVKSEADFDALAKQDTVEGLVINRIESLSKEEQDKLRDTYPAMDLDHCWILQEGRTVTELRAAAAGMLVGGVLLALLGLWLLLRPG